MAKDYAKIERVRRLIDKIAYYSLFLDMCIAVITSLSLLHIGNPDIILIPVNYLLTIVVVLSIGLFITLFFLKREENILDRLLGRTYKFNKKKHSFLGGIRMRRVYNRNKRLSE